MTCWAGPQPDSFSHKRHAPLKLQCTYCHSKAEKAERAGLDEVKCKVCHTVGRSAPRAAPPRLADFVFFSHARHRAAKIGCEICHGTVYDKDRPDQSPPVRMKDCVDCHKAKRASVACNVCHELNQ